MSPRPLTYQEIIDLGIEYGNAIKDNSPSGLVMGPVSYGFAGYENLQNAPDANGRNFLEVYLDAFQQAETSSGRRVLDVLDLHWYPEATGDGARITDSGVTPGEVTARIQAARSLWDPTYSENSWIVNDDLHAPINLIPSLRSKISAHYPGTKLAFTEYYYGGGSDISGGMAEADVLGVFGREGVFAASLWPMGSGDEFIHAAFEMYRRLDANGTAFGDTSIHADASDNDKTSVFASTDTAHPGRVVVICINKTGGILSAGINLTHGVQLASARVFTLTSAASSPAPGPAVSPAVTNGWVYSMPAMSVSALVLDP
jgi:hypothetical protein